MQIISKESNHMILNASKEKPNRHERRRRIKELRKIYNSQPHMIHEKQYTKMNCILCSKPMKTIHDTHNPFPLTKKCYPKEVFETDRKDRCCKTCETEKVIPARLKMFKINPENIIAIDPANATDEEMIKLRMCASIYDVPLSESESAY